MKQILRLWTLASLLVAIEAPFSLAGFSVPSHAYRMDYLDRAQVAAEYYGRPITFVYSDEYTDCRLATSASVDAFNYLEGQTVIVYAGRGDWEKFLRLCSAPLNRKKQGRIYQRQ